MMRGIKRTIVAMALAVTIFAATATPASAAVTNPPYYRSWLGTSFKCVWWPSGVSNNYGDYSEAMMPRWEVKINTDLHMLRLWSTNATKTDHHEIYSTGWQHMWGVAGLMSPANPQDYYYAGVAMDLKRFSPGAPEPGWLYEWQPVVTDADPSEAYFMHRAIVSTNGCMINRTGWLTTFSA
jgi:hypothetical protein